jgi:4'-phosphopantetheinyl transferase
MLDPVLLRRCFLTLSGEEQDRYRRFLPDWRRHQHLVSHALVRDVLSRYAAVLPAEWRFEVNPYGRPAIAECSESSDLRFSLSHTAGRSIVAVARGIDIGVDVESTTARAAPCEIADRFFSPLEIAQLKRNPDAFFDFWTLKEAYIKARGLGLAIPLDSFSVLLTDPDRPEVAFHSACPDRPERWHFAISRGPDYRMALAAATGAGQAVRIVEREIVPLADCGV